MRQRKIRGTRVNNGTKENKRGTRVNNRTKENKNKNIKEKIL